MPLLNRRAGVLAILSVAVIALAFLPALAALAAVFWIAGLVLFLFAVGCAGVAARRRP